VRLVCAKYGHRGDYAVSQLRERYGEATLIQVRETFRSTASDAALNTTDY
jgi:hypothetical protein